MLQNCISHLQCSSQPSYTHQLFSIQPPTATQSFPYLSLSWPLGSYSLKSVTTPQFTTCQLFETNSLKTSASSAHPRSRLSIWRNFHVLSPAAFHSRLKTKLSNYPILLLLLQSPKTTITDFHCNTTLSQWLEPLPISELALNLNQQPSSLQI